MATIRFTQIELNFLDFHKGLLESGSPEVVWQVLNGDDLLTFGSMCKLFILWAFFTNNKVYFTKMEDTHCYSFFSVDSFTHQFYMGDSESYTYGNKGVISFIQRSGIEDAELISDIVNKKTFIWREW